MQEQNDWTPFDQELAMALQGQPMIQTSHCLEPEVLLRMVKQGEEDSADTRLLAHVATCASCRRLYVDMMETWQLALEVRELRAASSLNPAHRDPLPEVASAPTTATPERKSEKLAAASVSSMFRWRKPAANWRLSGGRLALAASVMALAGLAVVWATVRSAYKEVAMLKSQLAQARQEQSHVQQTARVEIDSLHKQLADRPSMPGITPARDRQEEAQVRQAVETAVVTEHLETPRMLAALVPAQGVLRDEPGRPTLVLQRPVATYVGTSQPTLQWRTIPGARQYRVTVVDANNLVAAHSLDLPKTTWKVTPALAPGQVYRWQVIARQDGQDILSPYGAFQVLNSQDADRLARATRQYAGNHLTLGVLYAQAGLLDDADQEFAALRKAHPHSALVQRLQRDLQAVRQPEN